MIYDINKIKRDVRIAMDENQISSQLLVDGDTDTLALNDIIESKIEEAVRRVVTASPLHLLDGGVPFGDALYWRNSSVGWAMLPEDFLRLIIFKMNDWSRPVYEAIDETSPLYRQQSSPFKGLRGNPQRPVVAVVRRTEGMVLEFYSCDSQTARVEQALYLPTPHIDDDGGIMIPQKCYEAVVYMVASLSLVSVGQTELAGAMTELCKQLLK